MPDKWQARQATPVILQISSSKHNAKKITTRVRDPFHQSITAILTEEKREEKKTRVLVLRESEKINMAQQEPKESEEKQFTKPTHVAVYLFGDQDQDRRRL